MSHVTSHGTCNVLHATFQNSHSNACAHRPVEIPIRKSAAARRRRRVHIGKTLRSDDWRLASGAWKAHNKGELEEWNWRGGMNAKRHTTITCVYQNNNNAGPAVRTTSVLLYLCYIYTCSCTHIVSDWNRFVRRCGKMHSLSYIALASRTIGVRAQLAARFRRIRLYKVSQSSFVFFFSSASSNLYLKRKKIVG